MVESLDELTEANIPFEDDPMGEVVKLLESRDRIAKVLERLQPRSKEVVILRYFKNKTPQEIANIMKLSYGNVRVILTRALAQMGSFFEANNWKEN